MNIGASLKDSTRWPLLVTFLLNVAVFYLAVKTGRLVLGDAGSLLNAWQNILPGGIGLIFTSVFNEFLGSEDKARLVFWKRRHPLPGSEAFSKHGPVDPRVDMEALRKKLGTLPNDPRDQNVLWYRLYKSVSADPAVTHVHRNYLFTRDYAVLSFILIPVLGLSGFWMIPSLETAWSYLGILVVQYLVVRQAAKNHGIRLVTTVLALTAGDS